MTKLSFNGKTFAECAKFLNKKDKRKIGNNTELVKHERYFTIDLHFNSIVYIYSDDSIMLSTGGFWSKTTRERLNHFSPYKIFQQMGNWFIKTPEGTKNFISGMIITKDGKIFL